MLPSVVAGAKIYDDLIMDHIKNARNYRVLDDADRSARGVNPLCGDEVSIYLKIASERIEDIAFQCTCCGISMASASILGESVMGIATADAKSLLRGVVGMLDQRTDPATHGADSGQRALLETVREFPARARCAMLPWITLEAALENRQQVEFPR